MCIDNSFIVNTGDPNRKNINPEKLGTFDITGAEEAEKFGLFEFIARYVRKVHSDELIRKTLRLRLREVSNVTATSHGRD